MHSINRWAIRSLLLLSATDTSLRPYAAQGSTWHKIKLLVIGFSPRHVAPCRVSGTSIVFGEARQTLQVDRLVGEVQRVAGQPFSAKLFLSLHVLYLLSRHLNPDDAQDGDTELQNVIA